MKVVNMFVIHLNTNKTIVLGMKRNRRKRKIQSMIYTSTRVMTPWRLLCTFVAVVVVVFFVFLCLPLCFTLNRHNFQMVTITLVSLLSIRRSYIFDYFLFVRFHLAECQQCFEETKKKGNNKTLTTTLYAYPHTYYSTVGTFIRIFFFRCVGEIAASK